MMPSSHCWICDEYGAVYFLKNISIHCTNHISKPSIELFEWIKVGSDFSSIYAGYSGLVCAIKDSALHVRKGVTCENPMGTDWVVSMCDAIMVTLGTSCIVRKSSKGALYFAVIDDNFDSQVLDWKFIPPCQEDRELCCNFVVDSNDRLFGITTTGEVLCCKLLTNNLNWIFVTGPPPPNLFLGKTRRIIGLLSQIWRSEDNNKQDWVCMVSSGIDSIWCLRKGGNEVWQLVIGQLNDLIKANWVKLELPLCGKESVVTLSACKTFKDGLYCIVRDNGEDYKLVYCSLNGCGRVECLLPVKNSFRSLTISSTSEMVSNTKEKGICCEDSSCSWCMATVKYTTAHINASHLHAKQKRISLYEEDQVPSPKRRRKSFDLVKTEKFSLVDGVEICYNEDFLTKKVSCMVCTIIDDAGLRI